MSANEDRLRQLYFDLRYFEGSKSFSFCTMSASEDRFLRNINQLITAQP